MKTLLTIGLLALLAAPALAHHSFAMYDSNKTYVTQNALNVDSIISQAGNGNLSTVTQNVNANSYSRISPTGRR